MQQSSVRGDQWNGMWQWCVQPTQPANPSLSLHTKLLLMKIKPVPTFVSRLIRKCCINNPQRSLNLPEPKVMWWNNSYCDQQTQTNYSIKDNIQQTAIHHLCDGLILSFVFLKWQVIHSGGKYLFKRCISMQHPWMFPFSSTTSDVKYNSFTWLCRVRFIISKLWSLYTIFSMIVYYKIPHEPT